MYTECQCRRTSYIVLIHDKGRMLMIWRRWNHWFRKFLIAVVVPSLGLKPCCLSSTIPLSTYHSKTYSASPELFYQIVSLVFLIVRFVRVFPSFGMNLIIDFLKAVGKRPIEKHALNVFVSISTVLAAQFSKTFLLIFEAPATLFLVL